MSEIDPLKAVLREWKAPASSAELDARVRAGFRALRAPSPWRRFWRARITVPVPAVAAVALLLGLVWLVEFRPAAPAAAAAGVVTRLAETGFRPLPDGAARVEEVKQ